LILFSRTLTFCLFIYSLFSSATATSEIYTLSLHDALPILGVTGAVVDMPLFHPLIGMDKEEIVTIARRIGTLETSILPYEDCCTVFTPKHPKTKPELSQVEAAEAALDVEALIARALERTEKVTVKYYDD